MLSVCQHVNGMNKDIRISLLVLLVLLPILIGVVLFLKAVAGEFAMLISLALFTSILIFVQVYTARDNKAEIRHVHSELEALTNIYRILEIDRPFPALGGYVITAAMARVLLDLIYQNKPKTIVELGSGVSTLIMAYVVKKLSLGKIYSFDHEERFAQQTRDLLKQHDLQDYAKVIHAPLKQQSIQHKSCTWYDIQDLQGIDTVDLLIADGPPAQTQKWARYPAFPFFRNRLNKNSVVVLDDTHRKEELQIAKQWLAENTDWKMRQERGARCVVLTRED